MLAKDAFTTTKVSDTKIFCMEILADDVNLDCNGKKIIGSVVGPPDKPHKDAYPSEARWAVAIEGDNAIVQNCEIEGSFSVLQSKGSVIKDNKITLTNFVKQETTYPESLQIKSSQDITIANNLFIGRNDVSAKKSLWAAEIHIFYS